MGVAVGRLGRPPVEQEQEVLNGHAGADAHAQDDVHGPAADQRGAGGGGGRGDVLELVEEGVDGHGGRGAAVGVHEAPPQGGQVVGQARGLRSTHQAGGTGTGRENKACRQVRVVLCGGNKGDVVGWVI